MMLQYMEQHTLFARKQITKLGPRGQEQYRKMWKNLTMMLNERGPIVKKERDWEKVRNET